MLKIREAIIVEGRYDKIKLSSLVDAPIIETNGFRIFNDREKQNLIRKIAEKRGIIVLTDSDSAGFVIRNFLNGTVDRSKIKHCYIPQIEGKEKRKRQMGREGLLGVEGVGSEVILDALRRCTESVQADENSCGSLGITKADMVELGLAGTKNAGKNRVTLLKYLNLPTYLSANALLTVLNCLYSFEELSKLTASLEISQK